MLKKFESEREENEKFKDKWLKCKTMLQELEKKQKPLKMKLRETEIQRKKEETRNNVAEKGWKDAEKRLTALKQKLKGNRQKSKIPCENIVSPWKIC